MAALAGVNPPTMGSGERRSRASVSVVLARLGGSRWSFFHEKSTPPKRSFQGLAPACLTDADVVPDGRGEHGYTYLRPNLAPCMMTAFPTFSNLAPKTKNLIVAGGLSAFVFGVYFYTMKAVGGTDELQVAINKFEEEKHKQQDQPGSQAA